MLVGIRLHMPPVAVILTGSEYDGMPQLQQYEKEEGVMYKRLSAPEYCDALDEVFNKLAGSTHPSRLYLLHDKASPHTAHYTKEWLKHHEPHPIKLLQLPTDSPDLTPCDSCLFATVKAAVNKRKLDMGLDWSGACKEALTVIQQTNPDPHIQDVVLRWKACVAAYGWHIEQELTALKLERKRG